MEFSDGLARIILLVGFMVFAPVGMYFRVRSFTDERLNRLQEGWLILLSLRLLALAFLAGLAAFLVARAFDGLGVISLTKLSPLARRSFGAAASGLMIWTFRSLGHNLTDTVVTRRDATLITHGPYRWVRHPFYLAFAMAVIANTLITANAYLAIAGTAAFLVIVARTSIEEQKLIERFGPDYRDYMRRTGRFLPRFRLNDS